MLGAGGSNILRGGKRSYDCKTLVGNFVEEAYRPGALSGARDGGDAYASNTQRQMLEGVGASPKSFGAGLRRPDDPKFDYADIVGPDKTRGADTWLSPTEFAAPRELQGRRMPDDELDKHRARWTRESSGEMVKARYVTEMTAATDPVVRQQFRKELCTPTQVSFQ